MATTAELEYEAVKAGLVGLGFGHLSEWWRVPAADAPEIRTLEFTHEVSGSSVVTAALLSELAQGIGGRFEQEPPVGGRVRFVVTVTRELAPAKRRAA